MKLVLPTLLTAREVMTTDVVTVQPKTEIGEAADLLELHCISGLPVVDSQRKLLGVITEYDLLRGVTEASMHGTVADFMTPVAVTVTEETTVYDIAHIFLATHVRRVPVARGDLLVGVISRRDVVFAGVVRQHLLDIAQQHG